MHEKAKDQLIKILRVNIKDSTIEQDVFGKPICIIDDDKINNAVEKHAGDHIGWGFYWNFILNYFISCELAPNQAGKAVDLLNPVQINSIATRVVDYISSIPRKYRIYIPLRSSISPKNKRIKIGDDVFIVDKYAISEVVVPLLPSKTAYYLELVESGFSYAPLIGKQNYVANSAETEALNTLKRFMFFGCRFNMLQRENDENAPKQDQIWSTIVDEIDGVPIVGYFPLDDRLSSLLSAHKMESKYSLLVDAAKNLNKNAGDLFSGTAHRTTRWSTLSASSQWFVDSESNSFDYIVSFVFCVCLLSLFLVKDLMLAGSLDHCQIGRHIFWGEILMNEKG